MNCLECDRAIDRAVYNYSNDKFGIPLCRDHQDWVRKQEKKSTFYAMKLYFLLKENGVPAVLEKDDGYKCVDIVIEEAKVHIEVDGGHHNYDQRQALADLRRTYYSFREGYITLRIPNSLMCNDKVSKETADCITNFLVINRDRVKVKKSFSIFKLFQ